MSDQRLRELERAYRDDGDPAVGAQLLRARQQAGLAPPDAAETLALLQDPAALSQVPAASSFPTSWATLRDWIWTLRALGGEVLPRALCAWFRRIGSLLQVSSDHDEAVLGLAELLEAELRGAILDRAEPEWGELPLRQVPYGISQRHRELFTLLRMPALEFIDPRPLLSWDEALDEWPAWEEALAVICGRDDFEVAWVGELSAAIRDDLLPWAWGERDPLRDPRPLTLENVRIASPCYTKWSAMQGDARMRSCSDCTRMVFDLSELSEAEARTLLAREGSSVCVQLYRREDGRVLTRDCARGLRGRLDYGQVRGMLA